MFRSPDRAKIPVRPDQSGSILRTGGLDDIVDDLVRGRQAFHRRDWPRARDLMSAADLVDMDVDDLRSLAEPACLVGDDDS